MSLIAKLYHGNFVDTGPLIREVWDTVSPFILYFYIKT